jgi:hypothetical protein
MSPEYLMELAEDADPEQLWRQPLLARLDMPEDQRRKLDAGVALRRYASHIGRLHALLDTHQSLLLTPISKNSTAILTVETPPEHLKLRR